MSPTIDLLESQHTSSRNGADVAAIVLHATAGTNSRAWLVRNPRKVSAHTLVEKSGTIVRLVPDELAAHHCGYSQLVVAGKVYGRRSKPNPNQLTLGIELENLNDGRDPYTAAQLDAMGWQLAQWLRKYPDAQLLMHRDVDTQGKIDPAGLTWPVVLRWVGAHLQPAAAAADGSTTRRYSADVPFIGSPGMSAERLVSAARRRCRRAGSRYTDDELTALFYLYLRICADARVDPVVAVAQCLHETGNMTSARSQPPQHNLAGIGATDDDVPGAGFASLELAVRAQVGRLLAYALRDEQLRDDVSYPAELRQLLERRRELVAYALDVRKLSSDCRGSATTLRQLGWAHNPNQKSWCGWAYRGENYGQAIADVANALQT